MGKLKGKGRSPSMSYRAYARHRGVSPEAVSKAVKTGRITARPDGTIEAETADRQWEENTDPSKPLNSVTGEPKRRKGMEAPRMGAETPLPSGVPPYSQSKAVEAAIEAERKRLKLQKEKNKLISVDKVRVDSFNVSRLTRDKLLVIPDKLAPLLAAMNDPHEIHGFLLAEIRLICEDLIRDVEKISSL